MEGFGTKYGQSSSSKNVGDKKQKTKKSPYKQTWNDGRAPDVISKLVTRKKDTTTMVPKLLTKSFFEGPKISVSSTRISNYRGICCSQSLLNAYGGHYTQEVRNMLTKYKVAAVKWNIPPTTNKPGLSNTCSYDSNLFVLYFLHKNNVLQRTLPGIQHQLSKLPQIFDLLDQDNGDEARHLLVHKTCKNNEDYTRLKQLTQPGTVNVWSGVSDPLPVLLYGSFLRIKNRVACSLNCSPPKEWTILQQYVHPIDSFDFPENLEVYLNEKAFFCQSFHDEKNVVHLMQCHWTLLMMLVMQLVRLR
jgi:hypothetical protein